MALLSSALLTPARDPTGAKRRGRSAPRPGGLAVVVFLQGLGQLLLGHPRAAGDPRLLGIRQELLLRFVDVDAAVGAPRPVAGLRAALLGLRVGRACARALLGGHQDALSTARRSSSLLMSDRPSTSSSLALS